MDEDDEKALIRMNCKRFRDEAGWTQQELADRSGLAVASIARYEAPKQSRQSTPDRDALAALARAFNRDVGHFYMKEPPPYAPIPEARLKVDPGVPDDIVARVREFQRNINREILERAAKAKAQMRKGKKL